MTEFLHSRYSVVVAALLAVAAALFCFYIGDFNYLPGNVGLIKGWGAQLQLTPQISMAVALCINVGIALLLVALNKTFNLLRSLTMLPGTAFLCMQMATPEYLLHIQAGTILCLVVIACMFVMMANYANPCAQRSVFLVFFLLSGCSTFDNCYIAYLPVFWMACAQMKIFSLRTIIASLLGLATPWILLFGFAIIDPDDFNPIKLSIISNMQMSSMAYMLVTVGVTLLVAIVSWLQNIMKILSYNAQSRAQLGMIAVTMLITIVAMAIDFDDIYGYLPLLNCCVALQLGHIFGVIFKQKRSYWAILLILFLFIMIYAWRIIDRIL